MEQKQHNTIQDIINELKRLQVEHGNLPTVRYEENAGIESHLTAWPTFNEKGNVVEF